MSNKTTAPLVVYAWIGEDEHGSGVTGLKQGLVPAGYIPLAAMGHHLDRLTKVQTQMEVQAIAWGKRIYLAKFELVEVVAQTASGAPNPKLEQIK